MTEEAIVAIVKEIVFGAVLITVIVTMYKGLK
jgi:hypothetical protein